MESTTETSASRIANAPGAIGDLPRTRTSSRRRLIRAATVVGSAIPPLLAWTVAVPIAGIDLAVDAGGRELLVGPVEITSAAIAAGAAAWGVLALLERAFRPDAARGRRVFAVVGSIVLALSLLGPLTAGAGGATLWTLLLMHLATGATLMLGLPLAATTRASGNWCRRLTREG